jgi:adenylate kinase
LQIDEKQLLNQFAQTGKIMSKNIILLGAPGAGKGSQASLIAKEYGIPHISTGDIFRKNIKEGTPLGKLAKSIMDEGRLVPDDVTVALVESRLKEDDCKNGYILDGFPRTIPQAEALDKIAKIDIALNIVVPFETIISRLSGRRVCTCGQTYHTSLIGDADTCQKCGEKLFIREDDKPETIKKRLDVYEAQTAPLIEFYTKKGIVLDIDSTGTIEEGFSQIKEALK